MSSSFRNLISFLSLWLLATHATAQRLAFFNLKVEDGLAQSQATCLTQDKPGNLWIGTYGGISRFDGRKIRNYNVGDGLLSNAVSSIHYATSGRLYFCSTAGMQYFDGTSFKTLVTTQGDILKDVFQIVEDSSGRIFLLTTQNRLYEVNNRGRSDTAKKVDGMDSCTALCTVGSDLLCASTDGSLRRVNIKNGLFQTTTIYAGLTGSSVIKIFCDSRKRIWCTTSKGIAILKENRLQLFETENGLKLNFPALSIGEDNRGSIWFGFNGGVIRITDSTFNVIRHKNGLTDNMVYCIFRDSEGNLWMGTDGEGVFRYSGGPFVSLDEANGMLNKQVTSISGNRQGDLFFCGYMGAVLRYHSETGHFETLPLKPDATVQNVLWQEGKGLWMSSLTNGLSLFQTKAIPYRSKTGVSPSRITCLNLGVNGTLYAGYPGGVLCIQNETETRIRLNNALPRSLASRGTDSLFVVGSSGLKLFVRGQEVAFSHPSELDRADIQCMVLSHDKLYFGSTEKGVLIYTLSQNKLTTLNAKNGLSSDFIYTLIDDDKGNIWAGTGRGICRIRESAGKYYIQVYIKANGVIGLENNSGAAYRDEKGRLWFGTTEGVSCYMSNAKPVQPQVRSIVLESVSLLGGRSISDQFYAKLKGWYSIPEGLNLPYRYNNLSFSFQAITLSPSEKIEYQYTLDGPGVHLSEWIDVNTINFSSLEPGNYKLTITCKIDGVLQNAILNYSFGIKTPFHKSIWFIISIIGLAIMSGVYLQYAANRRKLKRQEREAALRREEQNKVRERTAEDFHDEVGNRLTRINLLANVLKTKLPAENLDAQRILQQIQDNSLQLYAGTRDILWSLQTSNDNLYEIINHIRDLAVELLSESNISFTLSGNDESFREVKMPLDKSRNFIMIWKEALSNCVKYAGATRVLFQVQRLQDERIQLRLVDDGTGFDTQERSSGNGLKNMHARATRLQAELTILSGTGGTQVILIMKEK